MRNGFIATWHMTLTTVATRVMFCRICNPTACNIRICDPQFIPIKLEIGSNRIANPDT